MQETFLEPIKQKVTNEENKKLTQTITLTELKTAIFQMENGKSPGIDGLPIESYKSFYELFKNDLLQLYNSILFKNDNLTLSMTKAIINLIPKNDQKEFLRNWRPISLLTADYKILTKILSDRLKPTLQNTISEEQTYGIPNRSIFSNLFTTQEIIAHSTTKKLKSHIVSIDQEKAFHKVDRQFLYKIIGKLGYSNIFITFIKKIYNDTMSVISNNGFLSDPFILSRGARQGCPLSLLLYTINGEVIYLNIKKNHNIIGYPIPNKKKAHKLSQYAADTFFFILTEDSIIEILKFFQKYQTATGAKINLSKTTIMLLANAKIYDLDKKITNIKIKGAIKILGIYFTDNLTITSTFNWNNCLQKIEKQIQQLSRRHLSLRGKAMLLNTLILSKVAFLSNVFPITNQIQQQLQSHIFKHLWRFS